MPRVSVVVMTFNRPEALRRCLASLAEQTLPRDAFDVVIVDVSDVPNHTIVADAARVLTVKHVIATNLGVSGNRNVGAGAASAPWLAFLDDDCVARPRWLESLLDAALAHPTAMIGGGVEALDPGNPVALAGQIISDAVDRTYNRDPLDGRFVPGLNFAVSAADYTRIGGTDADFGRLAAEDREFCDRWRASGGRLVKAPDAMVAHEHRTTLWGFLRQYFNYGRGAWLYHDIRKRHYEAHTDGTASSHLGLLRELLGQVATRPARELPGLLLLLAGWELANVAGFLYQAAHRAPDGRTESGR